MKKFIISALIIACLLLCACGAEKKEPAGKEYADGYETAYRSPRRTSRTLNGIFYDDENEDANGLTARRVWFFDFDSMKSAILCMRPNCPHSDPNTCTAFGIDCWSGYPTVVNNKLYYFSEKREWGENGEVIVSTEVYRAAPDGSSRVKADTIENLTVRDLAAKGSTAYFTAAEVEYEDYTGVSTGYTKVYICSYDYEKEKFSNLGLLAEGYDAGASVFGEYGRGLYIDGYYAAERGGEWTDFRLRVDLETGEISEWDMPISSLNENGKTKPMFASGGFYGYMDGENAVIIDSEGNEMVFENYELPDNIYAAPVNGYFFNAEAGNAIDLSSGEILELNPKAIPKYGYVLCYRDGYIVASEVSTGEYIKLSEDELFKR